MTPKLDLYDLIHSMTASEQNSFRKEINKRKGRHLYLQVFEAILEQETYDEADLKEQFKGEKTLGFFSHYYFPPLEYNLIITLIYNNDI